MGGNQRVAFEAATMYVCATSYPRTARERLSITAVDPAAGEPAPRAGCPVAEFAGVAPARLLRRLVAPAEDITVWVESSGYGVGRRLGRHRVMATPHRRAELLRRLRDAWRIGVGAIGHPDRDNAGPPIDQATALWRGLLAAGTPVRSDRGLRLPLPAGPLAGLAVIGASWLDVSARVRHVSEFSVVEIDNPVQVLRLVRLMPYRDDRPAATSGVEA